MVVKRTIETRSWKLYIERTKVQVLWLSGLDCWWSTDTFGCYCSNQTQDTQNSKQNIAHLTTSIYMCAFYL